MYTLDTSATNADRVVLRRSMSVNVAMRIVLLGLGLPMSIGGLVAFAFVPVSHPAPLVLLGLGVCIAALGQLVGNQFRAPRRLIFDLVRAQLFIDETGKDDAHAAAIPFDAIEGFRWLPHAALSGEGSGSVSAVVEMTKRNGAVWVLSCLRNSTDAAELVRILTDRVNFDVAATTACFPHEPRLVRIEQKGADTVLSWKRRYSIAQSALLFAATAGLATVVVGVRGIVSSALHYGAFVCTGLLAFLVLYALLAALRSRVVTISSDALRANCGVGRIGRFSVPLEQIDAVIFHFAPSQRDMLFVLRAEERRRLIALTRGKVSLEDALAARAMSSKLTRIEVGDLTMPEKLNLEHLLRRLIFERTGRVIH